MFNGGYTVLDFKGYSFTSGTEATLKGVHPVLAGNKKIKVVHGLVVGATKYPDMVAVFTAPVFPDFDKTYTAKIALADSTVTIAVAADDGINVTVA